MLGGILGPLIGAGASIIGQERANRANRQLAREQMQFQERMSGSSYQRAVEDMKLAGINPMLAYAQGGASSPGGQTARMEDVIGPAVSSAMSVMRMKKELKLMDAQTYKTEAEAHVADVSAKIADYGMPVTDATGRKRHVPYGALTRMAQFGLTQAQAAALKYSPFLSKFVGADALRSILGPRRAIGGPIKFQRSGALFDRYVKRRR